MTFDTWQTVRELKDRVAALEKKMDRLYELLQIGEKARGEKTETEEG